MASIKRERQLAHEKYLRQQQRRGERDIKRRQRQQAVAAVLSVCAVLVGVILVANLLNDNKQTAAQPTPSVTEPSVTEPAPVETSATQPTPSQPATPSPTPARFNGTCEYVATEQPAAKNLAGKPPTKVKARTSTATFTLNTKPVTVKVLGTKAPCTANSFRYLVSQKYYDNTPCHRMTKDQPGMGLSILQCGDPSGSGGGGPGYAFADENLPTAAAGVAYPAGTLAMANSMAPATNGSQFFIVYEDTVLDPKYTIFGTVTSGLDVVREIANTPFADPNMTWANEKPPIPVTLNSVKIS